MEFRNKKVKAVHFLELSPGLDVNDRVTASVGALMTRNRALPMSKYTYVEEPFRIMMGSGSRPLNPKPHN